jgi:hypothetical protein
MGANAIDAGGFCRKQYQKARTLSAGRCEQDGLFSDQYQGFFLAPNGFGRFDTKCREKINSWMFKSKQEKIIYKLTGYGFQIEKLQLTPHSTVIYRLKPNHTRRIQK